MVALKLDLKLELRQEQSRRKLERTQRGGVA
jgi:hypothetical protein